MQNDNSTKVRMINLEGYINAMDDVRTIISVERRKSDILRVVTERRIAAAEELGKLLGTTFTKGRTNAS